MEWKDLGLNGADDLGLNSGAPDTPDDGASDDGALFMISIGKLNLEWKDLGLNGADDLGLNSGAPDAPDDGALSSTPSLPPPLFTSSTPADTCALLGRNA